MKKLNPKKYINSPNPFKQLDKDLDRLLSPNKLKNGKVKDFGTASISKTSSYLAKKGYKSLGKIINPLHDWEAETDKLAQLFVKKYFKEADYYWIGNEIGGVIEVADYFFGLDRMVESLRYKASAKKLFDYYDLESEKMFEIPESKPDVNFRTYLKMK